jgi:hypothetical protein
VGNLIFTPAQDAVGVAHITVTVDDGAAQNNRVTRTFQIVVEAPGIALSSYGPFTTSESGGTASFNVRLAVKPLADVTINLSSTNLAEGTVGPATLVFTPENWDAGQTVTLTGVDDNVQDGNVAYQIVLDASSSADAAYKTLAPISLNATNLDNDLNKQWRVFVPLIVR